MKIIAAPVRSISAEIALVWRRLQESNPDLANPFFCPEFTDCVSAARDDVELALIEEGNRIEGIFPFQRCPRRIAKPVGGCLSDYQGIISSPGFYCNPINILAKCSLAVWQFDHLLASQTAFKEFHREMRASPVMDLADGYDTYAAVQRARGSEVIVKALRNSRKIQREVGPLQFEEHAADPTHLRTLIAWKSRQYEATGNVDRFATPWFREVVERVYTTQTPSFAGVLSLLYAGEHLIAAHMGMRTRSVWHYWFPAYDAQYARYSPGILLLLKMAEQASSRGVKLIDLGRGEEVFYKQRLMSRAVPLAVGSVELPSLRGIARRTSRLFRGVIRRTPLAGPARKMAGWLRLA